MPPRHFRGFHVAAAIFAAVFVFAAPRRHGCHDDADVSISRFRRRSPLLLRRWPPPIADAFDAAFCAAACFAEYAPQSQPEPPPAAAADFSPAAIIAGLRLRIEGSTRLIAADYSRLQAGRGRRQLPPPAMPISHELPPRR